MFLPHAKNAGLINKLAKNKGKRLVRKECVLAFMSSPCKKASKKST